MVNPFATPDQKELERKKKEVDAINDMTKRVQKTASHLLSGPMGKKYKYQLTETRDSLIKHCIKNINPDPIKDAFMLRAVINKLGVIYSILEGIEDDARTE